VPLPLTWLTYCKYVGFCWEEYILLTKKSYVGEIPKNLLGISPTVKSGGNNFLLSVKNYTCSIQRAPKCSNPKKAALHKVPYCRLDISYRCRFTRFHSGGPCHGNKNRMCHSSCQERWLYRRRWCHMDPVQKLWSAGW